MFFFSGSVTIECERQFAGSNGDPTLRRGDGRRARRHVRTVVRVLLAFAASGERDRWPPSPSSSSPCRTPCAADADVHVVAVHRAPSSSRTTPVSELGDFTLFPHWADVARRRRADRAVRPGRRRSSARRCSTAIHAERVDGRVPARHAGREPAACPTSPTGAGARSAPAYLHDAAKLLHAAAMFADPTSPPLPSKPPAHRAAASATCASTRWLRARALRRVARSPSCTTGRIGELRGCRPTLAGSEHAARRDGRPRCAFALELHRARRFYERPESAGARTETGRPDGATHARSCARRRPTSTSAWHRLGDHPALLRRLGLVDRAAGRRPRPGCATSRVAVGARSSAGGDTSGPADPGALRRGRATPSSPSPETVRLAPRPAPPRRHRALRRARHRRRRHRAQARPVHLDAARGCWHVEAQRRPDPRRPDRAAVDRLHRRPDRPGARARSARQNGQTPAAGGAAAGRPPLLSTEDVTRGMRVEVWDDDDRAGRRCTPGSSTSRSFGLGELLDDARRRTGSSRAPRPPRPPASRTARSTSTRRCSAGTGWSLSAPKPGLRVRHVNPPDAPIGRRRAGHRGRRAGDRDADWPSARSSSPTRSRPARCPGCATAGRTRSGRGRSTSPATPGPTPSGRAAADARRSPRPWRSMLARCGAADARRPSRRARCGRRCSPASSTCPPPNRRDAGGPGCPRSSARSTRIGAIARAPRTNGGPDRPGRSPDAGRASIVGRAFRAVVADPATSLVADTRVARRRRRQRGARRAPVVGDLLGPRSLALEADTSARCARSCAGIRCAPPAVVAKHRFSAGESLRQIVVRSGVTQDLDDARDHRHAARRLRRRPRRVRLPGASERHLAPPKTSQVEAELYGEFDDAIGSTDPAVHRQFAAIALREAGSFFDLDRAASTIPSATDPQLGVTLERDGAVSPVEREDAAAGPRRGAGSRASTSSTTSTSCACPTSPTSAARGHLARVPGRRPGPADRRTRSASRASPPATPASGRRGSRSGSFSAAPAELAGPARRPRAPRSTCRRATSSGSVSPRRSTATTSTGSACGAACRRSSATTRTSPRPSPTAGCGRSRRSTTCTLVHAVPAAARGAAPDRAPAGAPARGLGRGRPDRRRRRARPEHRLAHRWRRRWTDTVDDLSLPGPEDREERGVAFTTADPPSSRTSPCSSASTLQMRAARRSDRSGSTRRSTASATPSTAW